MSQSAPGWYQDHDDPRLARWWDGDRWTEHTLVLAEQDWSTEPAPPVDAGTRFPVDPAQDTAVETVPPASYEEDIYAPIRDPWGDEPVEPTAAAPAAWSDPDDVEWSGVAGGAAGAAAGVAAAEGTTQLATGWDDERWAEGTPRRPGLAGTVQDWPSWARIAVPLAAVLVLVLLVAALAGVFSGDDGGGVKADATTSTTQPSLADAAEAALEAAGDGPFTTATFTTLIQAACQAAQRNDPAALTERIALLGYDAPTISKLIDGLEVGTAKYCPDDMADAPTLLNQVRTDAVSGTTTSTSLVVDVPPDTTPTTARTTPTTRPRTTTTKKPVVTTTAPPPPPSSTTTTPPSSTTTPTTEPTTTSTATDGV